MIYPYKVIMSPNNIHPILLSILNKNNISNAYIFHGPDGIGKKETALEFIAKIINKSNSEIKALEKIRANNFPDFILIEPTYLIKGKLIKQSELIDDKNQKNKPVIRVDQIRELRKFLGIRSIQSEKKFIVIQDAHLLNEAASNCLLKILEEPENGLFILITSQINNLLDTIKSRCQQIRFNRLNNSELLKRIKGNKNFTVEIESKLTNLKDLLYLANGSPSKAWENISTWLEIPEKIKSKILSPLYNNVEILILVKEIIDELDFKQQELLIDFIQYRWWQETKSIETIEIIENLKSNIKNNVQLRLAWEVCLLKIALKNF